MLLSRMILRSFPVATLPLFTCLGLTSAQGAVDFVKDIAPVLESSCVQCHTEGKAKGKLMMHTKEAFMKGGETGALITVGKPEESLLIKRVLLPAEDDEAMPPKDKAERLTEAQVAAVKEWITAGAPWPDGVTLKAAKKVAVSPEDGVNLKEISLFPPVVNLETKRDFQSVIVVARYADDTTRDITEKVQFQISNPSLVTINGNELRPAANAPDAKAQIKVEFFGKTAEVPLTVKAAGTDRPVSFRLDVMPVMQRGGCNTGSCHGAARGQDGFRLSLFGFDPAADYHRITRELGSRRVNLAIPEESLMVEKAIGTVPHTGGKRYEADSDYNKVMLEWLQMGAPDDDVAKVAKCTGVEIFPPQVVLEGTGTTQAYVAVAKFSDGTDRDVTKLATWMTSNAPSGAIEQSGVVKAGNRGEAFIMARYAVFTTGSQALIIPKGLKYERPQVAEANYIDKLVNEKLHKLRLVPSGGCDDATFLRRVWIDIVGLLPDADQVTAFLADPAPNKREKLVDELLTRKEFAEIWVMKFAELLQIRTNPTNQVSYKSTLLYYNWLQERMAKNVPMNQIVRELLSANGGTFTNPATNYYQIEKDTLKLTENLAQVFMGMRIQCAQCHNHPFDRWTMDDYYSFAAFFAQIGRKGTEDPRELVIFNSGGGEQKHLVGGRAMKPKFLGGAEPEVKPGSDRRAALADWIASPDNPFFGTNLANMVWAHFFGLGIVEPVDDVRISNPPSNPELLDALGKKFTEYNFDFKRLVRDICLSETYQRTTQANDSNKGDTRNFSHSYIRRLKAEVMLDAVSGATKTKNKFQGLPEGARAVQIADGNVSNYFLRTFGRAERATVCSCEVKMEPNLSQALHMINGDATHVRISQGKVVETMLKEGKTPEQIIEQLYLTCFARRPSDEEKAALVKEATEAGDKKQQVIEDIFWALLNSKEFTFNH